MGRDGKNRGNRLMSGPIPAMVCTCCHLCIMEEADDRRTWHATGRSPALTCDPHSGSILCQLNQNTYKLHKTNEVLSIRLSIAAVKAMQDVAGVEGIPAADGSDSVNFGVDSFPNSKPGKMAIMAYMQVCRRLYQDVNGASLTDNQGFVQKLKKHPR